jgi:hypothetical protein
VQLCGFVCIKLRRFSFLSKTYVFFQSWNKNSEQKSASSSEGFYLTNACVQTWNESFEQSFLCGVKLQIFCFIERILITSAASMNKKAFFLNLNQNSIVVILSLSKPIVLFPLKILNP